MEKNLRNEEYNFDYIGIKNEILSSDVRLSSLDANTIKVYQLCQRLE
jgi:hypothetical protein